MESPARAALLVAMTLGLGGCFVSQRDETYGDTVVLDDVDVRVLHAVTDALALRLSAGGCRGGWCRDTASSRSGAAGGAGVR